MCSYAFLCISPLKGPEVLGMKKILVEICLLISIKSLYRYLVQECVLKFHNLGRSNTYPQNTSNMADYNSSYFSFSLDWPVTKNQKLNSIKQQMPTNFCCCHFSLKTKEVRLYSFKIETKKHRYFVFGF